MAARLRFTRQEDDPLGGIYRDFNERMMEKAKVEAATSSEVASIAARGLRRPWTLSDQQIRIVCASALGQTC